MSRKFKDDGAPAIFESVWDAICDTPEEAEHMKLRSDLMASLERFVRGHDMTQAQAAAAFGVTQPRVSDLMRRKFDRFTLDSLLLMATRAGLRPHIVLQDAA